MGEFLYRSDCCSAASHAAQGSLLVRSGRDHEIIDSQGLTPYNADVKALGMIPFNLWACLRRFLDFVNWTGDGLENAPHAAGIHFIKETHMRSIRFNPIVFVLAIIALAASSMAQAQATRTWVSGVGDDANPCSRTAPCKTFAGAISKTAAGGEISVLDPGGYGAVTITKSITIDGSGGSIAGILVTSGNGININSATAVVTLRNLDINGLSGTGTSTAASGIQITAAKTVTIEKCVIYGFGGGVARGISDTRSNTGNLVISDTIIRGNAQSAVVILPTAPVTAMLTRVQLTGNGNSGLVVLSNANATISDSDIAGNTNFGLFADGSAILNSENTRVSGNGQFGAITTGGGTIRLSNTVIVNNGAGFSNGGTINTFTPANNKITGNTSADVGVLTPIAQQ